jgi:wyosine [tRNA(Phe)-imidazoG37] synthetase (radical SAM superfamily)
MSNPYATNKAIAHVDRLYQLKRNEQPAPVHLHFIISDLCNQDCNFCAYRIDGYTEFFSTPDGNHNPARRIPYNKIVEILNDCKAMGVKAVQFTGGGEPTVHPKCREAIEYAHMLGLDTSLVTNGVRLNEALRETLMRSMWARISIDAGKPETYGAVRRVDPSIYWKVLDNCAKLAQLKQQKQSNLVIGIGWVVNKDNWQQIVQGVKDARETGVDNVRLSAVFQPDDAAYFRDFYAQAAEACAEAEGLATDTFAVINNFGARLADLSLGHPEYPKCHYQHMVTYIGGDMNLYRCCVLSYTKRGLVGSLEGVRFRDLWESRVKQEDYRQFNAHECPRCQFNDKNRATQEIMDGLPDTHVNFV